MFLFKRQEKNHLISSTEKGNQEQVITNITSNYNHLALPFDMPFAQYFLHLMQSVVVEEKLYKNTSIPNSK